MDFSLIIPAYNEAERISATLEHVQDYLESQAYSSEIIVVDDGSSDNTAQVVEEGFPEVQVIRYEPNQGKGCAVRTGMLAAVGEYRVFYDADASTPIEELEKLWPKFEEGADVVIGSRSLPDSYIEIPQPWYRAKMGKIFSLMVQCCGLWGIPDSQCGFKGFTQHAVQVIFPRQTIDHFSFDVELLFIARKHKLRVEQVPVRWINCPLTRVNALTDSSRMFYELLLIRFREIAGRYA